MFKTVIRVLYSRNLVLKSNCSTLKRQVENEKENFSNETKNPRITVLKKYWTAQFIDFIRNCEKIMENTFPKTMHVYKTFNTGTQEFKQDLKEYFQIRKKIKHQGIENLTRQELQLSFTFPKDVIKISPVLLLLVVPFTNYIIFPLAFYFPRLILTSHYWSNEDKLKFMLKEHKTRIKHNEPLLQCVQSQIGFIENPRLQKSFNNIIACLNKGTHPTIEDILLCKRLFSGPPYSLKYIRSKHVKELLKVHGMSQFGLRNRLRLFERGLLIKRMDVAIQQEGVTKLTCYDMKWALSFRGLNPMNVSDETMQACLNQWLLISSKIDTDSISLLLHCSIILAYSSETFILQSKEK